MEPETANEISTDALASPRLFLSRRSFLTSAAAGIATASATASAGEDLFQQGRDWTGNHPVTYPEPAFEVMDKRFKGRQGNSTLQRIWHGQGHDAALWCEGPVWMGDWGCLLWSDIPNNRVLRWNEENGAVSTFQSDLRCFWRFPPIHGATEFKV